MKKRVRSTLSGLGMATLFLTIGFVFLSLFEGWVGIFLWMLVAVPVCFLAEFLLRPRARRARSARSLPRMQVRAPVRGDPERAQPVTRVTRDPEFNWHREKPQETNRRRRIYAR